MEVVPLSRKQIREVYMTDLVNSFPEDETKPLAMILKSLEQGNYECQGLVENGNVLAYAFFVKNGKQYLLDYLGTKEALRNKGLGSRFLALLAEHYKDAQFLLAEVEDPEKAGSEADRAMQSRRLRFYLRNGFCDTGVTFLTFGVPYRLIELPLGMEHSEAETRDVYKGFYQMLLPDAMYRKNILEN